MNLLPLLQHAVATRPADGRAGIGIVEVSMRTGEMTPLHRHTTDEAVAVLDGTLTVLSDGATLVLSAGDSHVIPAGAVHTFRSEGGSVRYLTATIARSLGRYEDFARAVARPGDLGSSEAGLCAIARANDITVVGSPGVCPGEATVG